METGDDKSRPPATSELLLNRPAPVGACREGDSPTSVFACTSEIESWVRAQVEESDSSVVVVLEGGHFDPSVGADAFAVSSLACSLQIGRRLIERFGRKVRIVYGILIDDLGLKCDSNTCELKFRGRGPRDESLPSELETILGSDHFVKRDRVIVSAERRSRNRGLKELKRLIDRRAELANDLLAIEQQEGNTSYLLQTDDGFQVEVAKRDGTGWKVKCPLIMASHYCELFDKSAERFGGSHATAIIDFSALSDRYKVIRGSELALRGLVPADNSSRRSILNVFWGDTVGEYFLTDSYCSSAFR